MSIPHDTHVHQVIRDSRSGKTNHSEDECDSDSDCEYMAEGTPVSVEEDARCHSKQEPEPGPSVTLSTGALPT